jgi:hypothetical protein
MVARKLPSRICLSGKVKKKQFGEYDLRAYLGRYNVNIAKTSFSFLADKLGDKLVPDPHSPEGVIPEYPSRADFFAGTNL